MKVVFNTNYNAAGTKICVEDMIPKFEKAGHEVVRNDWDHYEKYDLILFMAPDSDVARAKRANPRAIVGIMDPKKIAGRQPETENRGADFLLVGSVGQRDFFLTYNKNIVIYYMFSEMKEVSKEHIQKEKIIIGYHGNKIHLNSMEEISKALDELSDKYNIELWAMYNIESRGRWTKNVPKKCKVKHIQWSEEHYHKYLTQCDIGIVPAKIPINLGLGRLATRMPSTFLRNWLRYDETDYLIRFKYSTNAGRVYPFSQFHIPVVADFLPPYAQLIQDGHSGSLVYSKEGWYDALEKLIQSPDLRNKMSSNLKKYIDINCSPDINFERFLEFIETIKNNIKIK